MASDLLDSLLNALTKFQAARISGVTIKDWRISLHRNQLITLGIKNNIGGSVYTPPAYKSNENADVFLIWSDGKCSNAKVQKQVAGQDFDWDKQLTQWRMAAFDDEYAAKLPSPMDLPDVNIKFPDIYKILNEDNSYIFDQQKKILSDRPKEAQTGANIMALWGEGHVRTSTGIDVNYDESRYAVSWSFDSQVSEGFAKRRLITEQEWDGHWQESLSKYDLIKKNGEPVNKDTVVVLAPSVVEHMIEQYILPNFRGENIIEGQSRFNKEDFAKDNKLFSTGLSIEINPLAPYNWESYIITSEGIPAVRTALISNGSLKSPYLSVKDANRWGSSPTAIPAGASGITVKHGQQADWVNSLKGIEDGILILSVLGLHTQNPVTGSFSLSAPSGIRIKNGQLVGKTDSRISGSFWDILKSDSTSYGKSPLYKHPYMLTQCKAENL